MKETNVLKAIENRFACKHYIDKPISEEDMEVILESARLAPTSFGLEHFDIYICNSKDIIDACYDQKSMKTAPISIVLTVKRGKYYNPDSPWLRERISRFPGTEEEFLSEYRGYYEALKEKGELDSWARAQAYMPCSNMINAASELGLESCPIEGFDNSSLLKKLGLNEEEDQVSLVCTFGYPSGKRERIRRKLSDIVHYKNK